jgi:hypothetical protein
MSPYATERSQAFRETLEAGAGEIVTVEVQQKAKGIKVWALVDRAPRMDPDDKARLNFGDRSFSTFEVPLCELQIAPRVGWTARDEEGMHHSCVQPPEVTDVSWKFFCTVEGATDAG